MEQKKPIRLIPKYSDNCCVNVQHANWNSDQILRNRMNKGNKGNPELLRWLCCESLYLHYTLVQLKRSKDSGFNIHFKVTLLHRVR